MNGRSGAGRHGRGRSRRPVSGRTVRRDRSQSWRRSGGPLGRVARPGGRPVRPRRSRREQGQGESGDGGTEETRHARSSSRGPPVGPSWSRGDRREESGTAGRTVDGRPTTGFTPQPRSGRQICTRDPLLKDKRPPFSRLAAFRHSGTNPLGAPRRLGSISAHDQLYKRPCGENAYRLELQAPQIASFAKRRGCRSCGPAIGREPLAYRSGSREPAYRPQP